MPEATVIPSETIVYVTGHNHGGYLPEGEPQLHLTIDGARASLAWELNDYADFLFEGELTEARDTFATEEEYNAHISEVHEDSASASASGELVKSDRDGDITAALHSGRDWSTHEAKSHVYWIMVSTIGEQFPNGDDDSEDYGNLLDEYQGM